MTHHSLLRMLLSQTQLADDRQVAIAVGSAQIGQQAGPLADHHEQAAPAGVVLLVRAQVLGQLGDSRREQSDLHFRRAGVGGFTPKLVNDLRLAVLGDRHRRPRPRGASIHRSRTTETVVLRSTTVSVVRPPYPQPHFSCLNINCFHSYHFNECIKPSRDFKSEKNLAAVSNRPGFQPRPNADEFGDWATKHTRARPRSDKRTGHDTETQKRSTKPQRSPKKQPTESCRYANTSCC